MAKPGETILLRAGVYREALRPTSDGVTVRAMKGEVVTISGADLIEGWRRETDGSWSAQLPSEPKKILRDGRPWCAFSYNQITKRIVERSGDPRLHLFETVMRDRVINLDGRKGVKLKDIRMTNTLKQTR
jgi:hypothetical protein